MQDPLKRIQEKRSEVQSSIENLLLKVKDLRQELEELDIADRVMSRLGGEDFGNIGVQAKSILGIAYNKPANIPTMPEMIVEALSRPQALPIGMEPRDILKFIADNYWPEVRSELVGPIVWRMWKRGELVKDGSLYSLPQKNEAVDGKPDQGSSTASDFNPAQGREAGPEGGTS